ncbi:aminoacetone oxidase family FAD-binding enzyme [bacterium]|nr:MAG: aminoacetone oxidase family FAD-binding enzyme [bacterium]
MTKTLIIGAGAAGLTAAYFAAKAGQSVLILEKTDKAGKKILMSGGTRCNVLPVVMNLDDYFTNASPNVLKKVFKSWSLNACKNWLQDEIGIPLATETESNKWFPESNSAKEVRDKLLEACLQLGVVIRYNQQVKELQKTDFGWEVITENKIYKADKVVMSTGGKSIPTTGTEGEGYRILRNLGHQLIEPYAALTPLKGAHPFEQGLQGISLNVELNVNSLGNQSQSNRSGFVFTHDGFSGPAVLDPSHYAVLHQLGRMEKPDYRVNWASKKREDWDAYLQSGRGLVLNRVKEWLPARLAESICAECGLMERSCAELRREERLNLVDKLTAYRLEISGNEGYRKAEVTGGGVPLDEINTATMESKLHSGLFICGELVDVFGRIGGFNFYWAWVSGRLAGKS